MYTISNYSLIKVISFIGLSLTDDIMVSHCPPRFWVFCFINYSSFFSENSCMMGCSTVKATGLVFVCFVVLNPCVLLVNRVDFGLFCFMNFPILHPPPQSVFFPGYGNTSTTFYRNSSLDAQSGQKRMLVGGIRKLFEQQHTPLPTNLL